MSSTEGSEEKDSVRVWVDGVCAMYPVSQLETLASEPVDSQCMFNASSYGGRSWLEVMTCDVGPDTQCTCSPRRCGCNFLSCGQ